MKFKGVIAQSDYDEGPEVKALFYNEITECTVFAEFEVEVEIPNEQERYILVNQMKVNALNAEKAKAQKKIAIIDQAIQELMALPAPTA